MIRLGLNWSYRLFPILAFTSSVLFSTAASSSVLENHLAARFAFFAALKMLPIYPPNGERPGEIYTSPYPSSSFEYRCDEKIKDFCDSCFPGVRPHITRHTILPKTMEVYRSRLEVEGYGSARGIARVSAQQDISIKDVAYIDFEDVIIKELTRSEIKDSIRSNMNVSCHSYILRTLSGDPGENAQKGVPWVIETVYYAKETSFFAADMDFSAAVQADLRAAIRKVGLEAGFSKTRDGISIISGNTVSLPVAWRPAYVSLDHFTKMQDANNRNLFRRILEALGLKDNRRDILRQLRSEFPDEFVRPHKIIDQMAHGKAMQIDQHSTQHLEYFRQSGILIAGSLEYFQEW